MKKVNLPYIHTNTENPSCQDTRQLATKQPNVLFADALDTLPHAMWNIHAPGLLNDIIHKRETFYTSSC